jgi:hypothetical protein
VVDVHGHAAKLQVILTETSPAVATVDLSKSEAS